MAPIHIGLPQLLPSPTGIGGTLSAPVEIDRAPLTLWYRYEGLIPEPRSESFLATLLLPAMARHLPIECEGPVSAALLRQLPTIQDIYATWVPTLARVEIRAPVRPTDAPGPGVAGFFTGGVDSFHTLLSHRNEIRTLVHVPSFEAPLRSAPLRDEIATRLDAAAAAFSARLIRVETNLTAPEVVCIIEPARLSPTLWNFELTHGAALASIAHGLPAAIGRVYIAASTTYDDLFPWGSHPLLDPLWSSETLEVVHDGCAVSRIDKVRGLAGCDVALAALQVCAAPDRTAYNCCRCEKCIRTMVALEIAGALSRCRAFPDRLSLLRVALLPSDFRCRPYLVENLRAAEATRSHARLARALRVALRPGSLQRHALELGLSAHKLLRRVHPRPVQR